MSRVEIGIFALIFLNCLYVGFLYGRWRARKQIIDHIINGDPELEDIDDDMIIEEMSVTTNTTKPRNDLN